MPVGNPDVIDAIGIERESGVAVLTNADHMEWDDGNQHLLALQVKINRYLDFIETGEIYESYPLAVGKQLRIDVVCRYAPSESGERLLELAMDVVRHAGLSLTWRVPALE